MDWNREAGVDMDWEQRGGGGGEWRWIENRAKILEMDWEQ